MQKRIVLNTIAALLLVFLIASCSAIPRFTSNENNIEKPSIATNPTRFSSDDDPIIVTSDSTDNDITYNNFTVLETVTGIASFYADYFHGKITYNGEVYDMYGLTAAHPTYPMGTKMIVTNLGNGKSVEIRINDRMPVHPDRIIDLSLGTAKEIGMENAGLANVMLEITEWGKGRE